MTKLNISSNSTAYVFDDLEGMPTAVYHIEGAVHQFLIDTYCGTGYLAEVIEKIQSIDKPLIVINTHHHWDHIWGNCAFTGQPMIAHCDCRKACNETWEEQLKENIKYAKGNCTKTLPTITFESSMIFEEDGILLFHTPGHTKDSISIFDSVHRVMYTGDNAELPLVYLNHANLDLYETSLRKYLSFKPLRYTASHSLTVTQEDMIRLIQYISDLKCNKVLTFDDPYANSIHQQNLLLLNKYDRYRDCCKPEDFTMNSFPD